MLPLEPLPSSEAAPPSGRDGGGGGLGELWRGVFSGLFGCTECGMLRGAGGGGGGGAGAGCDDWDDDDDVYLRAAGCGGVGCSEYTPDEPDEAEIARMVEEERTVREAVASAKKGEAIVKEHLIRARRDRSISATPLEL